MRPTGPPDPAPSRRPALLVPAVLAVGLVTSCASTEDDPSPVLGLLAGGRYVEALAVAAERYEADPDDAEREHEYKQASVGVLLEKARRATFDDRDDRALELLAEAEEIDPGNPVVAVWRDKTNAKLAEIWLDRAQTFAAQDDLASAIDCYEQALVHEPQNTAAQQGRARMLILANYREGVGEQYYKEGVRSLREWYLQQARRQFLYTSRKYDPDHEEAAERGDRVEELLADEKVDSAWEFENAGHYFAAGNEYRLALLFDPENEDAQDGRARMEREIGAKEQLDHADWLRLRGRFDEARDALAEGREMTDVQQEAFDASVIDIEEQELRLIYDEALRLEHDYQFVEAIEAYDRLLEEAGYYEDAITRRSTLEGFVEEATALYAAAAEAESPEEELQLLRQVQLVWPEYRDIDRRVKALEAELE